MSEKKSERLEVRLGFQEKTDFVEACETQGDTPSSAMRRFIRGYVRRADADLFASAWRGLGKWRYILPSVIAVLVVSLSVWGFHVVTLDRAPTDDEIFSALDMNSDGILQAAEHGLLNRARDKTNAVLKVLDLDASGTISREEFVANGRMVFALDAENTVLPEGNDPRLTFVEFEFQKGGVQSNTFQNSIIDAGDFDRFVIWYADGSNARFESGVEIRTDGIFEIKSDTVTFPSSIAVETKDDGVTVASPKPKDETQ